MRTDGLLEERVVREVLAAIIIIRNRNKWAKKHEYLSPPGEYSVAGNKAKHEFFLPLTKGIGVQFVRWWPPVQPSQVSLSLRWLHDGSPPQWFFRTLNRRGIPFSPLVEFAFLLVHFSNGIPME